MNRIVIGAAMLALLGASSAMALGPAPETRLCAGCNRPDADARGGDLQLAQKTPPANSPLAELDRASATLSRQQAMPARQAAELQRRFRRAIDWQNPRSRGATQYRTALNEALAEFWRDPAAGMAQNVAAQRFLVVMPGCGTQCQSVLLVDLVDGVAINPNVTAELGASFALNSAALIVSPASEIRQLAGPDGHIPTPVEAVGYAISPQGALTRRFAIAVH